MARQQKARAKVDRSLEAHKVMRRRNREALGATDHDEDSLTDVRVTEVKRKYRQASGNVVAWKTIREGPGEKTHHKKTSVKNQRGTLDALPDEAKPETKGKF